MSKIKRSRAFDGIITNLDRDLSPAISSRIEMEEKQTAFIDQMWSKAERDEKAGLTAPQIIYSGMQEQGHYTADPVFDKSRDAVRHAKTLPVKQYEITPNGDLVKVLDEDSAALHMLLDGHWCHNCEEPQPEMPEMWRHIADRFEGLAGPPPAEHAHNWRHGVMCCYCGATLAIEGDYRPEASSITQVTPEQRRMLETMFGTFTGAEPGAGGTAPAPLLPIDPSGVVRV